MLYTVSPKSDDPDSPVDIDKVISRLKLHGIAAGILDGKGFYYEIRTDKPVTGDAKKSLADYNIDKISV